LARDLPKLITLEPPALHLVHEEDPEGEEEEEGQDVRQQRKQARAALALDLRLDVVLLEAVEQLGLRGVGVRVGLVVARPVNLLDVERVVLRIPGDRLDLVVVHPLHEGRVVGGLVTRAGTDQALGEKRQHDDDQDRKGCAAEKTSQFGSPLPGFTPNLRARIYRESTSVASAALRVFPQCGDVGEVPVALVVVEAVADCELVWDLEADVADRQIHPPPLRLREQGADLDRLRASRLQLRSR